MFNCRPNFASLGHKAFVLPMTLVLLAIAATLLAAACRASLARAVSSHREMDELQSRWGMISCQTALLPGAEALIRQADGSSRGAACSISAGFLLGGQAFNVTLADEQAKLSLPAIYIRRGRAEAERLARSAARTMDGHLAVRLHPFQRDSRPRPTIDWRPSPLQSLGQVYALGGDDEPPAAEAARLMEASRHFTCWGDGRLHWRRAAADELTAWCGPDLPPDIVKRLLASRGGSEVSLVTALTNLSLTPERRDAAESLLTDGSACHSLWVVNRLKAVESAARPNAAGHVPDARERVAYRLAVNAENDGRPAETIVFEW